MAERSYRRTRYLVKPDLQTKYALMFVLAIGVGLNLGVILSLVAPLLKSHGPIFSLIYLLILGGGLIVLVAGISIVFTHKIAGPIFKIERSFRQIVDEKDLSVRIFLRTDDELQELAEEVNRLLEQLRTAFMLENQKMEAIRAKIDLMIEQLQHNTLDPSLDLNEQLQELRRKIEDMGLKYKLN